ncbi:hypothetical protein AX774_g5652 [Zancudomyces culisetae]|uniref:Uncharacterized protein n=1 Tax=Zancudomyces culisetae TaxID=1213189 RepID=A0A1R1PJ22_ZANCU|nr:hypothetical protein AX774_g5652 [Zancudomyces culisetae]|eukprot:OMH80903.1 hypothetical protein AX774_g5652 [Zancudomyces culisetae]
MAELQNLAYTNSKTQKNTCSSLMMKQTRRTGFVSLVEKTHPHEFQHTISVLFLETGSELAILIVHREALKQLSALLIFF